MPDEFGYWTTRMESFESIPGDADACVNLYFLADPAGSPGMSRLARYRSIS